jgi:hypothetical protein
LRYSTLGLVSFYVIAETDWLSILDGHLSQVFFDACEHLECLREALFHRLLTEEVVREDLPFDHSVIVDRHGYQYQIAAAVTLLLLLEVRLKDEVEDGLTGRLDLARAASVSFKEQLEELIVLE